MKAKQKLLTIQDNESGKCIIRRGTNGSGYQLFMTDSVNSVFCEACFPIGQDFVAEEFSKQGKIWKYE
jgi:hypothetical protein